MPARQYGVLLVSFSKHSHQRSFIEAFQNHPRIRLVGVADDPDIEPYLKPLNQKWASDLGIPYLESISDAVQRSDVNIVSIGHEIERRARIAVMAANAGKHLWIDKFIGADVTECRQVVKAVAESGIKSILPSYVYNKFVGQSKDVMAYGDIGDLMGIHIDIMFNKGAPVDIPDEIRPGHFLPPGHWKYPDLKRELLTVGAYAVGLIMCFFDEIVEVYGQGDAYFFQEHARRGADDFGTLTIVDAKGRIGTLSAGRTGTASHIFGMQQAYMFGTKGTGFVDGNRPRIDAYIRSDILNADYTPPPDDPMQWAGSPPAPAIPLGHDPMVAALEDFVTALDENRDSKFTVSLAAEHMEILFAGYQSIVRNRPVTLPLNEDGKS